MTKVVDGWLPRSPDLNPIENQWSVLKTFAKEEKASTSVEFSRDNGCMGKAGNEDRELVGGVCALEDRKAPRQRGESPQLSKVQTESDGYLQKRQVHLMNCSVCFH
jgi:hypothetical protein